MSVTRRPVPKLPDTPRVRTIGKKVRRSYPTGRLEFSRGFVGDPMELTIRAEEPIAPEVRAVLVTSFGEDKPGAAGKPGTAGTPGVTGKPVAAAQPKDPLATLPFERVDDRTLVCRLTPDRPGLFWFRAEFSVDGGTSWLHDTVPDAWLMVDPKQVDGMRLYTLIPGVSGSMADWTKELPKIRAMGFDTVHLLPLTVLDTSRSPYSARNLFDVEPAYRDRAGDADRVDGLTQLEAFVAAAAKLGVRLCFDLVLNHVGVDSDIARRSPEWIVPDEASPDGLRRARYWSGHAWLPWEDLVLIDYEHPSAKIRADVWNYMTEYALFWANYASQTGGFVRFDNLHSSDKKFLDHLTAALRANYPDVGVIAEYFTDVGTMLNTVPAWGLNLNLATPWDQKFVPPLREYLKYLHSVSRHVRFFMPVSSHDSGSPAQEFGSVKSTVPRYVAAALLGTGATGITQGVEWGVEHKIEFIGEPKRVMPGEPVFAEFLRKVNEVLLAEPAFRRGANCHFVDGGHDAVIAAFRTDGRPGKPGLLVACNFDIGGVQAVEADLTPFLAGEAGVESGRSGAGGAAGGGTGGPLKAVDLLSGREHAFAGPRVRLELPPCSAWVLRF